MLKSLHAPDGRKHKKEPFSLTSTKLGKRAHTHNGNRYDTSIVADSPRECKEEKTMLDDFKTVERIKHLYLSLTPENQQRFFAFVLALKENEEKAMLDDSETEKVTTQLETPKIQGMQFTGRFVSTGAGTAVPLYRFAEPADGKPDINTAEGWNASTMRNIEWKLTKKLGRKPTEEEKQAQLDADRKLGEELLAETKERERRERAKW